MEIEVLQIDQVVILIEHQILQMNQHRELHVFENLLKKMILFLETRRVKIEIQIRILTNLMMI